jgi:hypothetical protein
MEKTITGLVVVAAVISLASVGAMGQSGKVEAVSHRTIGDGQEDGVVSMEAMSSQLDEVMDRMASMINWMQANQKARMAEAGEESENGTMSRQQAMMMIMMQSVQGMGDQMLEIMSQMQRMMGDYQMMGNADTKSNLARMQKCLGSMTDCMSVMTLGMEQMNRAVAAPRTE